MLREKTAHDATYKNFFSDPLMVRSLLEDFVPQEIVVDLDVSTLERCASSYVSDTLRERHDDMVWRIRWKQDKWCYLVLMLEFQSSADPWMALRITSYTCLLLQDLIKAENIKADEGLPPVFPIVIYNGNREWTAAQEVSELFAPMPKCLQVYRPQQKYFLLDEGAVPQEKLDNAQSLCAQLVRMERAKNFDVLRDIVRDLLQLLQGAEYVHLRRAFALMAGGTAPCASI